MPDSYCETPTHDFDPLADSRWLEFIRNHPRASVFHTPEWLEAVHRTYGYRPIALTTSPPSQPLVNGLVFCEIRSWLTGRRLVSLPFSDHCGPLVSSAGHLELLLRGMHEKVVDGEFRYAEVRPPVALPSQPEWQAGQRFYNHCLDLRPGADAVFRHAHKDCIQRRIRHAERSGVTISVRRDSNILDDFYSLVLETRRRHGLPPQPRKWFRNVLESFGGSAAIRCAYKGGRPIAAILTLQYSKCLNYKYGASLARFHRFGAMPYLIWSAIQDATSCGIEELDLGRTDCDDIGLSIFKGRWNAARSVTTYLRFPADAATAVSPNQRFVRLARAVVKQMPESCLVALGRFSYRHIA